MYLRMDRETQDVELGTRDKMLGKLMKGSTAAELDNLINEKRNCRVTTTFIVPGKYMMQAWDDKCNDIVRFLKCHQAQGWPLSSSPRAASAATPGNKEVSGKDILAAELSGKQSDNAKNNAFDLIDIEAEKLGCDKVGSNKSTACVDLNIQRLNLNNGDPQMKGTSTDTATQQKSATILKPVESKANSPKTSSVDAASGTSASQCVVASLSDRVYFRSGDKSECPRIIDGACHNYKVTLTMTNSCKRTVASAVNWGGKEGFVSAAGRNFGETQCHASSGSPGSPKTTCSPGTLIDPKFAD